MAEWSIAAVLKTVVLRGTGGSNPSLSARKRQIKDSNLFDGFYLPFFVVYPPYERGLHKTRGCVKKQNRYHYVVSF